MSNAAKIALERATYQLLYKVGGYYGCVVSSMRHVFTTAIPTAGVRYVPEEKGMELAVNPEWFLNLTEPERVGLLLHEVDHIMFLHVLGRDKDFPIHHVGNIAQDAAINDIIGKMNPADIKLPEGAVYPSSIQCPMNKSADFYYGELIKKQQQQSQKQQQQPPQNGDGSGDDSSSNDDGQQQQQSQQPKKGAGKDKAAGKPMQLPGDAEGQTIDVHDWSANGKPMQEKLEAVKNVLERAKERAQQLGSVGKVPDAVQEALDAIEKLKVRQWHRELRRFLAHNTDGADRVRSWSRPNKRYGLWEAGTKNGPNKKLIIGVDTSGSMSQDEICQALAECKAMLRCSVEAEVWFFDTRVNTKAKLKKSGSYDVGGRGGTDYADFLDKARRAKCDGVIVFTDGDCNFPSDPKLPLLWVLTAGLRNIPFGHVVVLDKPE
jgi:predicted metal-dependent peptidase